MTKKPKRQDSNQLAKFIIDEVSSKEKLPEDKPTKKNKTAVELGRLGGV